MRARIGPGRGWRSSVAGMIGLIVATMSVQRGVAAAPDEPPKDARPAVASRVRPPRFVAVVIGIAEYPHQGEMAIPPSYGAGRDAHDFAEWLKSEGGWSAGDVLLMTDSGASTPGGSLDEPGNVKPTRGHLTEFAFGRWLDARLGSKPRPDDLVVIYFAGQAVSRPEDRGGVPVDRGYLMALDGRWAIDEAVDSLAARGAQVLCLLDTSLDGRPRPVPDGKSGASGRAFLQRITRQSGVSAWLAASAGPAAVAPRFSERSPFTSAMLQGLGKQGARNNLVACLKRMGADRRLSDQKFASSGNLHPRLTLWAGDFRGGDRESEILLQRGHSRPVGHLAYSPGGDVLFTGSSDSTVRAWRLSDRTLLRVLATQYDAITALAVSGDGRIVVAGDGTGAVQAWDHEHRRLLPSPAVTDGNVCEDAAFLADTTRFVTRDKNGQCRLWSMSKDGVYLPREVSNTAIALAASDSDGPIGFVVAETRGPAAPVLLRFARDGTPLGAVDGPGGRVKSAALATDGRRVVAGDADGRLILRDEVERRVLPLPGLDSEVVAVSLARDRLAVAERDRVHLFDLAGGARGVGSAIAIPAGSRVISLRLSGDASRLAARIDTHPGALAWAIDGDGPPRPLPLEREGSRAISIAFSPDGRTLSAGCQDGSLRSWSLDSGEPALSLPKGRGRVASLTGGGSGRTLLQMTSDGYAFAWDLQEGGGPKPLSEAGPRRSPEWSSGTLSPDGKVAYLTHEDRGDLVAFDTATGVRRPDRFALPPGTTRGLGRAVVARDPASVRIAAAVLGEATACVWDDRGRLVRAVSHVFGPDPLEREFVDLDLSPDGRFLLAAGRQGTVGVFDLEKSEPGSPLQPTRVATLVADGYMTPRKERLTSAKFVPSSGEGRPLRVALVSAVPHDDQGVGSRVRLWEPGKDAVPAPLSGLVDGEVTALASSADGKWLTAGADRTIVVWDLRGERPRNMRLTPRPNHLERVRALVVQAEPPMIISGGDDTQIRFWPLGGARPNELLGSLALDQNTGGWVAYTVKLNARQAPGGLERKYLRFDSSLGGELGVSFIEGEEVRTLEQFGQESRLLALTEYLRQGKVPDPPEDVGHRDAEPPRIAIEAPNHRVTQTAEDRLTIALGPRPLQELRLYHNTVPIEVEPSAWRGRTEVTVPVRLLKGENRFYAMASVSDALDGRSNEVDLIYRGPEDDPKLHILALGVGNYHDPAMQLRYAVKDASDFAEHLRRNNTGLPGRDGYFRVLANDEISEASITAEFNALERAVKGRPQDRVILFLAGHTDVDLRVFSLLLPSYPDLSDAKGTRLTLASLYRKLTRLPALSRAVVVDACRTQDIASDPRIRQIRALVNEQAHGARTTYILAARRAGQLVGEVDALEHGVLTYVLLRGLGAAGLASPPEASALDGLTAGADLDGDGFVTADELGKFADANVPRLVTQFPQIVQRSGPGSVPSRRAVDKRPTEPEPVSDSSPASFPIYRLGTRPDVPDGGR